MHNLRRIVTVALYALGLSLMAGSAQAQTPAPTHAPGHSMPGAPGAAAGVPGGGNVDADHDAPDSGGHPVPGAKIPGAPGPAPGVPDADAADDHMND